MNENVIRTIRLEMNRYLNNYQMSKLTEVLYKRLYSNDEEISNEEYLDKFISSKKLEGCSELTIKNYTTHISKLFNYLDKDIRTIDTDDLRNYLAYYQNENNCNNLTIDGVRRSLSLVKETYSDEMLEKLRNNCSNIRNLAIVDLLASSGIRISELVNLNIENVNFENKFCVVFGKGKKMREVYFPKK